MKDIIPLVKTWLKETQTAALATVIKTWGSSPRPAGAGMAVNKDGKIAGSVSGGCVESAVIQAAQEVIKSHQPVRLHFGVTDDQAWEVGLACGGEIEVYIRPFTIENLRLWEQAYSRKSAFYAVFPLLQDSTDAVKEVFFFDNDDEEINPHDLDLNAELVNQASDLLAAGRSAIYQSPERDSEDYFIQVIPVPLRLIIVGGVHIALPLVKLAEQLDFEVTVVDPRRLFSAKERFPGVTLITEWPSNAFENIQITESTAVVMLTHDPKIDDPAMMIALNSAAFYVGALGSTKTHMKRLERLRSEGFTETKLKEIHAPVGLDLGGKSPAEIALSIMAEIVQVWNSR